MILADVKPGEAFVWQGGTYLMLDQTKSTHFNKDFITSDGVFVILLSCKRGRDTPILTRFTAIHDTEVELYEPV